MRLEAECHGTTAQNQDVGHTTETWSENLTRENRVCANESWRGVWKGPQTVGTLERILGLLEA